MTNTGPTLSLAGLGQQGTLLTEEGSGREGWLGTHIWDINLQILNKLQPLRASIQSEKCQRPVIWIKWRGELRNTNKCICTTFNIELFGHYFVKPQRQEVNQKTRSRSWHVSWSHRFSVKNLKGKSHSQIMAPSIYSHPLKNRVSFERETI